MRNFLFIVVLAVLAAGCGRKAATIDNAQETGNDAPSSSVNVKTLVSENEPAELVAKAESSKEAPQREIPRNRAEAFAEWMRMNKPTFDVSKGPNGEEIVVKEMLTDDRWRLKRGYKNPKEGTAIIGHGEQILWWDKDNKKTQVMDRWYMKNGQENGPYVGYHPNGELGVRGIYSEGKKDGEWLKFDSKGTLTASENYKKGERHGLWVLGNPESDIYSEQNYKDGVLHGVVLKKAKTILGPGQPQVFPEQKLLYKFEFVDGKPKYDRKKGTKADFYNMMDAIAIQGSFDSKIGYFGVFWEQPFFDIFGQPDRRVPRRDGFGNVMLTFRCSDGVIIFDKVSIGAGKVATMYP